MTAKSKVTLLLALCSGAALLGSCQSSLRMWVIPGSTAANLVFGFAESRQREEEVRSQSIQVFPCGSLKKGAGRLTSETEALWQADVPAGVTAPPSNRIVYGRDEHGLRTTRGPAPLAAGCYAALAYGRDQRDRLRAGALRFEVTEDGKVSGR
jgi:predicted nucleic acid-binding protein